MAFVSVSGHRAHSALPQEKRLARELARPEHPGENESPRLLPWPELDTNEAGMGCSSSLKGSF